MGESQEEVLEVTHKEGEKEGTKEVTVYHRELDRWVKTEYPKELPAERFEELAKEMFYALINLEARGELPDAQS